jgi:hypothetical protein
VEIRELIIRCVSQMVLARVNNVKSGWKSMFMVFTTAAGDGDPTIVRLAFDTVEKIVREYFGHITGGWVLGRACGCVAACVCVCVCVCVCCGVVRRGRAARACGGLSGGGSPPAEPRLNTP